LIAPHNISVLLKGIHSQEPVTGLTHNFYKYPARFSPDFTRAAIQVFTEPGDVVYDPFLGGGTTAVEAVSSGRRAVGTDINSLAVFLSTVKTSVLRRPQMNAIQSWVKRVTPKLTLSTPPQRAYDWANMGYQRNINTRETWRIRKLLELAVAESCSLTTAQEQNFVRCLILSTAQWALDCRKYIPGVKEFRDQFELIAANMLCGAKKYAHVVHRIEKQQIINYVQRQPLFLHRSTVGIENDPALASYRPIKLVLTSPPYPGVHVLYHRWQVQGRRETPAPFWITSCYDGQGASYYTFGDRKAQGLNIYFSQALAAFKSVARIADKETLIVQMVAFSESRSQVKRYTKMMMNAGFAEVKFPELANRPDGRVWRTVPNRKWYASQRGTIPSSSEVVLFHRLRET
jgi:hypothetical protein